MVCIAGYQYPTVKVGGGVRGRRQYLRLPLTVRIYSGVNEATSKRQLQPPARQPENADHAGGLVRGVSDRQSDCNIFLFTASKGAATRVAAERGGNNFPLGRPKATTAPTEVVKKSKVTVYEQ